MYEILDRINSPQDVKKLTPKELSSLCTEIREFLSDSVSNTGGHLASNLGVVELTIALHRVFDSPSDKLVWDVGHQSYVHKLLTGRKDLFHSLRQYGGISGFPDPCESQHDSFCTGHASTSISACVGMAIARNLKGEDYNIIAVIGDGGLTGGMSYEAMNHAGNLGTRIIVVLADNGMSISPTVGALAKHLNKFRLDCRVKQAKTRTMRMLSRTKLGNLIDWVLHRITRGAKATFMPTMLFEDLGFTYIGPVDGHDITGIETALEQAKSNMDKPSLVHVITTKGKGYDKAEASPVRYHALPPKNGNSNRAVSYTSVFSQTLSKLMAENPRIVAITAAMSEGNSLEKIAREYPDRFFDVGICEEHAVTMAAGMAAQGFIPVVAIYSTFLQRGFDQVIHDVCLQKLPVLFAMDRSGIVGEDGKTHQGIFDLSYLTLIPDMIVSAPGDENELQHLLYTGISAGQPMAIRYPRGEGHGVLLDEQLKRLPIGKGEIIRQGEDIALVAIGSTLHPAIEAADILADKGINAAVINARFVKPPDTELITDIALNIKNIVTIEENTVMGGFGSTVLEVLNNAGITAKVRIIGIPDIFVEHGSPELLRTKYKFDTTGIVDQVLSYFPELVKLQVRESNIKTA
jgi:1-deoxy-D-xylulose-5-phosphate synthase